MSVSDWIWLGLLAVAVVGLLILLNHISKPYDVKNEEEFERRRRQAGRATGLMGLQQILDPAAKKSVEVQQDLRRGIYDDEEEPDDPPEGGGTHASGMPQRHQRSTPEACVPMED